MRHVGVTKGVWKGPSLYTHPVLQAPLLQSIASNEHGMIMATAFLSSLSGLDTRKRC
jgi:hypothetical protein